MDTLELILEVLKYVLPGGLILLAIKLVQDNQTKKQEADSRHRLKSEILREHLPLKLAAYERAVLFLERINPEQLVLREPGAGMNVAQYRAALIREVRQEYDHNIAQQVYIHPQAWESLIEGKNQIIQLILATSEQLPPEAPAKELAGRLFSTYQQLEVKSNRNAILMLKSDIGQFFTF